MTVDSPLDDGDALHVFTDGASRGNPGPAACAYVYATADGEVFHSEADSLGETTNNRAEYRAIRLALADAAGVHRGPVRVHSDSELVVKQLHGEYSVRSENLRPLYEEVREQAREFGDLTFRHVPREHPLLDEADSRCNDLLDDVGA